MISDRSILQLIGVRLQKQSMAGNWRCPVAVGECQPNGFIRLGPPVAVQIPVRTVAPVFFSVRVYQQHHHAKGIPCMR